MTDIHDRPPRSSPLTAPGRPVPEPRPRRVEVDRSTNPARLAILVGLVLLAGLGGGWPLLLMIAALVVMIFLHELGHYLTAKWAGMKVTEFFIGFGPRIWSFRRGETEYGVKVIPAGAYVKVIGMNNLDEYDPADADRTYMAKPFWRRISVAVAGSTMHFLLALACLFMAFAVVGVPGGSLTDRSWVVREDISEGSPAMQAGVLPGDRIVSVDGNVITDFDSFTDYVRERPGETVAIVLERDGTRIDREVALADEHPQTGEDVGFFGVGADTAPPETSGVFSAVGQTFVAFGDLTQETFGGIGRILSPSGLSDLGSRVVNANDEGPAVGDGDPPPSASDEVDDDLRRPVSIVGLTRIGTDILSEDAGDIFLLFALINVFIGIFNLLPLLPLDGGLAVVAIYEKLRSMRQGGRPYHVDVVKLLPLTYAVVMVMVFLGVSTIYLDIADPIGG